MLGSDEIGVKSAERFWNVIEGGEKRRDVVKYFGIVKRVAKS